MIVHLPLDVSSVTWNIHLGRNEELLGKFCPGEPTESTDGDYMYVSVGEPVKFMYWQV